MKSGGKTTDVGVGRKMLCKERPSARITSQCAKQVKKTVTAAKRGLTAKQQKLWRKYVYTSALLQAERFCDTESKKPVFGGRILGGSGRESSKPEPTRAQKYNKCVAKVLSGTRKVEGLFKIKFKWADFLIHGAKLVKKTSPKYDFGSGRPGTKGINPNKTQ